MLKKIYEQIQAEHAWDHLGDEGQRIQKVLAGIDPDDEWKASKLGICSLSLRGFQ